jgi:hypothetical protein
VPGGAGLPHRLGHVEDVDVSGLTVAVLAESQVAPIDYVEDGRRHRVRIGDQVDIEIEDFVPPQTPDGPVERLTGVFHPANSTLRMATASRVNAAPWG